MRKALSLGLAAVWIVSGGAVAPAPTPPAEVAAFLSTTMLTPADVASVDARCDAADKLSRRLFADLQARTGPATIDGDFAAYDALGNLIGDVAGQMYFVSQTSTSKPIRDAGQKCAQRLGDLGSDIALSRPVYDRLAAIPLDGADVVTRYTIGKELLDYRLAGVDRDAATRARLAAIDKEITEIGMEFNRNISEDKTEVVLDGADALAGLPRDFIDAHKPGGDGRIRLTTSYPDVFPVLRFADKAETRKAVYLAFSNRAHPKNDAVLARLLAKREEMAKLLGFPDFATYVTKDKMVGSPQRVQAFLDEVNGAAMAAAKKDADKLLARYRLFDPGATQLTPWSQSYTARLVRKEQYDVDSALVRQYFTRDKAQAGIFKLMKDMFDADIRPWNTEVWAPGVSAWELWDGKTLIGRFYLDLSPRDGKYSHAAHFRLQTGADGRTPISALVCNFPATGPMEHGDVETFLHEFGHLIHALYSGHNRYSTQTMSALQRDFIEAPSTLLEEWVWDYDTLKGFASNPAGEPIPAELVAKMNRARRFGEALGEQQQLGYSAVSLGYYSRPAGFDLKASYNELYNRYSLIPESPDAHSYAAFGHLYGYSAAYYTYSWSRGIAVDLLTRFRAAGLRDRATAMAYRKAVLEPGGTKPADQLIRDFLGRPTNTQAFRDELLKGAE